MASKLRQITARLGMAGTGQHAACLRLQRERIAGTPAEVGAVSPGFVGTPGGAA